MGKRGARLCRQLPAPTPPSDVFQILDDELFERVLRTAGFTARHAAVLPSVSRRWRAAHARIMAGRTPFPQQLAVVCSSAGTVLLLQLQGGAASSPVPPLARHGCSEGGTELATLQAVLARPAPPGGAWPTFVVRVRQTGLDGCVLGLTEYARGVSQITLSTPPGAPPVVVADVLHSIAQESLEGLVFLSLSGPATTPATRHKPAATIHTRVFVACVQPAGILQCTIDTTGFLRVIGRVPLPSLDGGALVVWALTLHGHAVFATIHTRDAAQYRLPSRVATGGVLRIGLLPSGCADVADIRWAVPPGSLNRPADLCFSKDGSRAYVTAFVPKGGPRRCVYAFRTTAGMAWPRERGFGSSLELGGLTPWGVARSPATGNIFVTSHGAAREAGAAAPDGVGCVAELCWRTGRLLARWTHPQLVDAQPNSLAFL